MVDYSKYLIVTFYNNKYKKYHKLLLSSIQKYEPQLQIESLNININSNEFKNDLNSYCNFRIDVKTKLIIQTIQKNIGKKVLFLDCSSLFLKPFLHYINEHMLNKDLLCIQEFYETNTSKKPINIGLLCIEASQKTLNFFDNILQTQLKYKNVWDQVLYQIFLDNNGHAYHLSNELINNIKINVKCKINIEILPRELYSSFSMPECSIESIKDKHFIKLIRKRDEYIDTLTNHLGIRL